jgi:hypothetical protein
MNLDEVVHEIIEGHSSRMILDFSRETENAHLHLHSNWLDLKAPVPVPRDTMLRLIASENLEYKELIAA